MKNRDGFSLLEILIALVIFAITVGGLLETLGNHLRNVSFTEDHARAVRIASREMNSLRRLTYFSEEEIQGEEGRFVWLATVEESDLDDMPGMDSSEESSRNASKPCLMNVTVQWSDSAGGELTKRVNLQGYELFRQR